MHVRPSLIRRVGERFGLGARIAAPTCGSSRSSPAQHHTRLRRRPRRADQRNHHRSGPRAAGAGRTGRCWQRRCRRADPVALLQRTSPSISASPGRRASKRAIVRRCGASRRPLPRWPLSAKLFASSLRTGHRLRSDQPVAARGRRLTRPNRSQYSTSRGRNS